MRSVSSHILVALLIAVALTTLVVAKAVVDVLVSYSLAGETVLTVLVMEDSNNPLASIFSIFFDISPYLAASSWVAFVAIWKGTFRRLWTLNGFDHDLFRAMVMMRGSQTRLLILKNLQIPKNRLQLAKDLGMHWESINNHTDTLSKHQLVSEFASVGVAQYLIITEKGKKVVELLETNQTDSSFSTQKTSNFIDSP